MRTIRPKAIIYDESDTAITVTGRYYPGAKGRRDRFGCPMEPDDEPEITIDDAVDQYGNTISLTADQEIEALNRMWESGE